MALCLAYTIPEITAQPWFQVLNSHQGQSAYPGFSHRAGHINYNKQLDKNNWFYH